MSNNGNLAAVSSRSSDKIEASEEYSYIGKCLIPFTIKTQLVMRTTTLFSRKLQVILGMATGLRGFLRSYVASVCIPQCGTLDK